MFQHVGEDIHGRLISPGMEIDGLFCDETKSAIFRWRREIGMEYEGSLKIEVRTPLHFKTGTDLKQKETSGGCIDPKTLASLLSSITSVHYQLDALDVERVSCLTNHQANTVASKRPLLKYWTYSQNMA